MALLLIDATKFSSGMDSGLTKQHISLLHGNFVKDVLVIVNKMDAINWNKEQFDDIVKKLKQYFKVEGLLDKVNITFIPMSAYNGENMIKKHKVDWYKGESLFGELMKVPNPQADNMIKPIRLTIKNLFKGVNGKKKGLGLTVKIEGGVLTEKDKLLIMPHGLLVPVKSIFREETKIPYGICGDTVDIILNMSKEEDFDTIEKGNIACCSVHPIPFVKKFRAKIYTGKMRHPIIPGAKYTIHIGLQSNLGIFTKLVQELDLKSEKLKNKRPRLLGSKSIGIVDIKLDERVCMEISDNFNVYGKIQIRDEFNTVGYGKITELLE